MPFTSELGQTVEGFFSLYSGFSQTDNTRPLRWTINADLWVQLSGWCKWTDTNTTVPQGEQRTFGGVALTDTTCQPPGIRDFTIESIFGPMHCAIFPSGKLFFRDANKALSLVQNNSWFSFDNAFYRLY